MTQSSSKPPLTAILGPKNAFIGYFRSFAVSVVVFISCFVFQAVCATVSDQYYKTSTTPLPDRLHSFFNSGPPKWAASSIVNNLHIVLVVCTLIRFVLFTHYLITLMILTRYFYIFSLLYIIRGVSVAVTTLPNPLDTCIPYPAEHRLLGIIKGTLMMISANWYECTDLVISGHTLLTTTLLLLWIYYGYRSTVSLVIIVLYACFLLFMIDISFFHYTVDIFLGFVLTVVTWYGYHLLLENAATRFKVHGSLAPVVGINGFSKSCCFPIDLVLVAGWLENLELRLTLFMQEELKANYRLPDIIDDEASLSAVNSLGPINEFKEKTGNFPTFRRISQSSNASSIISIPVGGIDTLAQSGAETIAPEETIPSAYFTSELFGVISSTRYEEAYCGDGAYNFYLFKYIESQGFAFFRRRAGSYRSVSIV